jgi:hypothetical protein
MTPEGPRRFGAPSNSRSRPLVDWTVVISLKGTQMRSMPRWSHPMVAITAVLGVTGCGVSGISDAVLGSCAKPPARPIGVEQARRALHAEGVELPDRGDCRDTDGRIVAELQVNTKESAVFCEIDKYPSPRTRDVPTTIFQRKSSTGKAYSFVLANIECNIYTKDCIDAVRRAMVRLGGRRTEAW